MTLLEAIVFGIPTICGRCHREVDEVLPNCGWCRECKNEYDRELRKRKKVER